jgi:hypothetical protein
MLTVRKPVHLPGCATTYEGIGNLTSARDICAIRSLPGELVDAELYALTEHVDEAEDEMVPYLLGKRAEMTSSLTCEMGN